MQNHKRQIQNKLNKKQGLKYRSCRRLRNSDKNKYVSLEQIEKIAVMGNGLKNLEKKE